MELDEEKRRHNETIKILRKKERHVKEIMVSIEEQNQQIALLQEALDKVGHKANLYKRQLQEQVRDHIQKKLYDLYLKSSYMC